MILQSGAVQGRMSVLFVAFRHSGSSRRTAVRFPRGKPQLLLRRQIGRASPCGILPLICRSPNTPAESADPPPTS